MSSDQLVNIEGAPKPAMDPREVVRGVLAKLPDEHSIRAIDFDSGR